MESLEITWQTLAAIIGGAIILSNGAGLIVKMTSPFRKIAARLNTCEGKLERDYARLNSAENADKMICKTLLALLDHEITGNSIERLKSTKKDLQNFIIDK